jgi:hypothetical protein
VRFDWFDVAVMVHMFGLLLGGRHLYLLGG